VTLRPHVLSALLNHLREQLNHTKDGRFTKVMSDRAALSDRINSTERSLREAQEALQAVEPSTTPDELAGLVGRLSLPASSAAEPPSRALVSPATPFTPAAASRLSCPPSGGSLFTRGVATGASQPFSASTYSCGAGAFGGASGTLSSATTSVGGADGLPLDSPACAPGDRAPGPRP
jgi:hypothetical protein